MPSNTAALSDINMTAYEHLEVSRVRFFDIALALALLVPGVLIMAVIYVAYLLTIHDGGPFLYRGLRLGLGRKTFTILKIRTLRCEAERQIGAKLYNGEKELKLWYSHLLRQSRIDEIPQLFNILAGDMTFIGPRPVRPNMYAHELREIADYDHRFRVLPGLTGYSQFLTPYGTSKEIRSKIDNLFLRIKLSERRRIAFIIWSAIRCAQIACIEAAKPILHTTLLRIRSSSAKDRRTEPRVKPRTIRRATLAPAGVDKLALTVIDLNDDAMLVESTKDIASEYITAVPVQLHVQEKKRSRMRTHCVSVMTTIMFTRPTRPAGDRSRDTYRYVLSYTPKTEYHRYTIDRYVRKTSIA